MSRLFFQIGKFFSLLTFSALNEKDTGLRKYRSAYVQVARKNAKSTVAAVLANCFLVMEGGQQDIYTAAVSRDQARIVFDDARQMCLTFAFTEKTAQYSTAQTHQP